MGFVGVAPGTTTLTLPDGSVIALADWIDDKHFGTIELENGDTSAIEMFQTGRSQQIPGGTRVQTKVDTNIPRSGDSGLPKDWELLVFGLAAKPVRAMRPNAQGMFILPDTGGAFSDPLILRTLFNVDRVTALSYIYNNKEYSSGVIEDYPQGHGYFVFSTNPAFELAQNGVPSPRDRNALVLPIHERENLGYRWTYQPEAALVIAQPASDGGDDLTAVDIRGYKNGLVKRTVV